MQSRLIKKSFFQHTKISISHYTKANEQSQISSATTYCELAVHLLIFEKYQSCVCTAVTLSHRFKAFSPPFCRQNRFRHEPPESFCKLTSGRALNRPRSPEVRKPLVYFWFFSYTRKARKTSLSQEVSRFCKPRFSTPQPQLRTATIKTFSRKLRGSVNLESAHRSRSFAPQQLKPFPKGASRFSKPRFSAHR